MGIADVSGQLNTHIEIEPSPILADQLSGTVRHHRDVTYIEYSASDPNCPKSIFQFREDYNQGYAHAVREREHIPQLTITEIEQTLQKFQAVRGTSSDLFFVGRHEAIIETLQAQRLVYDNAYDQGIREAAELWNRAKKELLEECTAVSQVYERAKDYIQEVINGIWSQDISTGSPNHGYAVAFTTRVSQIMLIEKVYVPPEIGDQTNLVFFSKAKGISREETAILRVEGEKIFAQTDLTNQKIELTPTQFTMSKTFGEIFIILDEEPQS